MRLFRVLVMCLACDLVTASANAGRKARPNIIFFLADDQDRRLGSMDFMPILQSEMMAKGVDFTNHHTTTAQCCPSRVTMMRGQYAHNTNITNVMAPGGNYEKFMLSGQSDDYLPHWLKKAGYATEYIGKFLNGVNILNWHIPPAGWDHVDYLVEPYQTAATNVVMSKDGATPIAFRGYHQSDVIRAKALSRLQHLIDAEKPFFLWLSPTAPHVDDEKETTIPCQRHSKLFPNITAPRSPNYNPPDGFQMMKGNQMATLPVMDQANITWTDLEYRRRAQSLQGLDEMLGDILSYLEERGELDNTYVIYSSDNGYHLGNHRMTTGKATAYVEDTNLPFLIRGPGVPSGAKSNLPSTFVDLAPTLLDIAGLDEDKWPSFLDGRSLLQQWKNPSMEYPGSGSGNSQEILNIEYWGFQRIPYPGSEQRYPNSTYKSVRIVGDDFAYFYLQWCGSNHVELYDTTADPYELNNLAYNPDAQARNLINRLNAMLLVQKSCSTRTCRNPWTVLLANTTLPSISTLKEAMQPAYDSYFDAFPRVNMAACLGFQERANERPFWPPEAESLGMENRQPTDALGPTIKCKVLVPYSDFEVGTAEDRHLTIEDIERGMNVRELTAQELDRNQTCITKASGGL